MEMPIFFYSPDKVTAWKRVLLEKLILPQLIKEFCPFMGLEIS
jgi:hypothetical protein